MHYLEEIDFKTPEFGDLYDELPLWSAHFGLMLLENVSLGSGTTILDVGAGTGSKAQVIAVDPWEAAINRLNRKLNHLGIQKRSNPRTGRGHDRSA